MARDSNPLLQTVAVTLGLTAVGLAAGLHRIVWRAWQVLSVIWLLFWGGLWWYLAPMDDSATLLAAAITFGGPILAAGAIKALQYIFGLEPGQSVEKSKAADGD